MSQLPPRRGKKSGHLSQEQSSQQRQRKQSKLLSQGKYIHLKAFRVLQPDPVNICSKFCYTHYTTAPEITVSII